MKTFADYSFSQCMTPYYGGIAAMLPLRRLCCIDGNDTAINTIGLAACGVVAMFEDS